MHKEVKIFKILQRNKIYQTLGLVINNPDLLKLIYVIYVIKTNKFGAYETCL